MVQTCRKLCCSTVAVLRHAGNMPVVVNNRCLGFDSAVRRRGQGLRFALLGVVLEFIAGCGYGADGKDCALALLGFVLVVPRLQAWRRQSSPHVEKTVKIPQLQLVGGAVLGQGRLARCCARQEVVQTVQKPLKFPHASLDMVVDISVVAQRQFPWAWLFSRP